MKLKKNLQLNLKWSGRAGHCDEKVVNFPLDNDMRCDFNVVVDVVGNLERNGYDLFKVNVQDLIVHKDGEYVGISNKQLVNLVTNIQDNVTW